MEILCKTVQGPSPYSASFPVLYPSLMPVCLRYRLSLQPGFSKTDNREKNHRRPAADMKCDREIDFVYFMPLQLNFVKVA